MATEPAHTVSKADASVYQVLKRNRRKDSQKDTHRCTPTRSEEAGMMGNSLQHGLGLQETL